MPDAAPTPPPPAPPAEAAAPADKPLSADEIKAAKRKEIEANLAALKIKQEKEAEQKSTFFGEHTGITCDGCGMGPIVGYRYHCRDCANHDVCETCYDNFTQGKVTNGLGKQVVSLKAEDHRFKLHKDKAFSSLVKGDKKEATTKAGPKCKPNDPCPCGSGKKYKKCCGDGSKVEGKAATVDNSLKVSVAGK